MQPDFPHIFLSEVDSTNSFASNLIAKINPIHGFCIYTDFQSAGRGQFGRDWHSQHGKNLLCTFIFKKPKFFLRELFDIHVWLCLAGLHGLQKFTTVPISIKWPNDLYANDKKLGGILIENTWRGEALEHVIAGFGINVNQVDFPAGIQATSLALLDHKEYRVADILQSLRSEILELEQSIADNGVNAYLPIYNRCLYGKNAPIELRLKNGEVVRGVLLRVDAAGELVLRADGKNITVGRQDVKH